MSGLKKHLPCRRTYFHTVRKKVSAKKRVEAANAMTYPLEVPGLRDFSSVNLSGLKFTLKCKPVQEVPKEDIQWAYKLCESSVKSYYETTCGWNGNAKYREMTEPSARFLIAYDMDQRPVAFSHFRFDTDYGYDVLYCYELHVEENLRGKGLGKFILSLLELIAFSLSLYKVCLTVCKANTRAVAFYEKCKYVKDVSCPEDSKEETFHYLILSKVNKKRRRKPY